MTETDVISTDAATESPADPGSSAPAAGAERRRRGGITGMVLAELRELAGSLGVDTTGLRRGDLIAEIRKRQSGAAQLPLGDDAAPSADEAPTPETGAGGDGGPRRRGGRRRATGEAPAETAGAAPTTPDQAPTPDPSATTDVTAGDVTATTDAVAAPTPTESGTVGEADRAGQAGEGDRAGEGDGGSGRPARSRGRRGARREAGSPGESSGASGERAGRSDGSGSTEQPSAAGGDVEDPPRRPQQEQQDRSGDEQGARESSGEHADRGRDSSGEHADRGRGRGRDQRGDQQRDQRGDQQRDQNGQRGGDQRGQQQDDDDEEGGGRRRGRRFRDRRRNRNERGGQGQGQGGGEPEVRDDDVLIPVAGILDLLDNYAFVRTSGYSSGPNDVYVSLSLVRKHGLRRGDAVTGQVRQQREGEQNRQKFNPLVRIDSINGLEPDQARRRAEFTKLTPLYPNERLRLETEPSQLTSRVIDLVMPVGKGQRALIVSPPKAGKTTIMQNLANAITTNNPEVHLMVVLVDERPEEVTDMQRSVKGEVIASTFDRPPSDHTSLSELAIERAKRLVEMGHDVVVLLDNITRLGRAYNLAAPASGRILSGGVDSTALYPPKRFLGAARNIEEGGSLTIFATALVETGSTMDTVIFEEFKGTGNAELKLDRKIADKRVFPAIDIGDSGTRKEELLMSPDEHAVVVKLRRVLAALDDQQAIDLVLSQLRKTRTNIEFLMQVSKNTPGKDED